MLTKTTWSTNFLFQICMELKRGGHLCGWSENAEDIFVCFRENTVRAKEIVLWRNKDVLLNVELFPARTWTFAFP